MGDLRALQRTFHALPGLFLVLLPDADFSVGAASAEYLQATHRDASLFGRPLNTLFSDAVPSAGVSTLPLLQQSLQRVLATGCADSMPAQQFDVRLPAQAGGGVEVHFWLSTNSPVLAEDGTVEFIVHRVQEAAAKGNRGAIGILDSITEGFYTLDRQWRFDYVNREACRILGCAPGELPGQLVWQAYPGLEGTEIERRYRRAMHQRETGSFTAFYAGHGRWYEITVYPAAEGISVFFRDVTAQHDMLCERDALMAESEKQRRIFETALDSTPDFVSVFDLGHRLVYANAALLKAWGVSEARGKRLAEVGYPQWLAERHDREIDQAVALRAPVRAEVMFTGTSGPRLYDYIFAPVLDAQGEVVALAATARDITERQQMAERMGESQRLEAIGTLAGGVAHDFNNMLAAILANIALAEQDLPAGSFERERLQLAHRAAERARSLVRQILTFSRRAPHLQQVQLLQPLVEEAVAMLRSTLPPNVRVSVRASTTPLAACVEQAQFQQMVINLCTNAWQALKDERGQLRVSLVPVDLTAYRAEALGLAAGEHLRLRVTDNGQGMDDAVRAHIFEPFFTTKPLGQGTGLGLAVVHGVVKESAGAVRVASKPGRGTVISVYLPRAVVPVLNAADVASPAPGPPPRPDGRVLYVDDDEIVSLTAAALLGRAGIAVTCVPDGPAALAALQDQPGRHIAVVTDYNMPGMSGLALAEALRDTAPGLPVIIISGLVTDELQAASHRLGVRQVVLKEHMLERLVAAIEQALQPWPQPPADGAPTSAQVRVTASA